MTEEFLSGRLHLPPKSTENCAIVLLRFWGRHFRVRFIIVRLVQIRAKNPLMEAKEEEKDEEGQEEQGPGGTAAKKVHSKLIGAKKGI